MYKRNILALLAILFLLFGFGCTSFIQRGEKTTRTEGTSILIVKDLFSSADRSNTTVTGKVTVIADGMATLLLGELNDNPLDEIPIDVPNDDILNKQPEDMNESNLVMPTEDPAETNDTPAMPSPGPVENVFPKASATAANESTAQPLFKDSGESIDLSLADIIAAGAPVDLHVADVLRVSFDAGGNICEAKIASAYKDDLGERDGINDDNTAEDSVAPAVGGQGNGKG